VFGDDTIVSVMLSTVPEWNACFLILHFQDDDAQRYARKVNLRSVASRVQSEYSFRTNCKLKEEYHGVDE